MKKILFPTDFSETATNAFLHALGFAKLIDGELILLHTYEMPIIDNEFATINYKEIYDSLELANLDKFKEEVPKLRAIAEENGMQNIKLSHLLMSGDLMFNIKETIKKELIDFVVMGTSGAIGWFDSFLGTNTGEAISDLKVPIVSVSKDAKYTKIETICFTTRFREKDKKALKQVLEIAKLAKAEVKCLYVKTNESDNTNETIEAWKEEFKNDKVTFFIIPNDVVQETIIEFITNQGVDVLAMLTYKRSFFESLFSSSLTKKMSYTLDIPILALHE